MRTPVLSIILLLSVSLAFVHFARAEQREEHDRKPDLVVDDDKVQCPDAEFPPSRTRSMLPALAI